MSVFRRSSHAENNMSVRVTFSSGSIFGAAPSVGDADAAAAAAAVPHFLVLRTCSLVHTPKSPTTKRAPWDHRPVALRSGVLFMRGPEDGHRTNGIGPGEYDGNNALLRGQF